MTKLAGLLAGVALAAAARQAVAHTDLKFALDWKFEGPSAPYFVAIDKGYYKGEGLNVTIDTGPGSVAGIARVAAGTYPMGFFDINSLVKFQDQNPDKKVQAVMVMYNRPPFAIATTTRTGISKPQRSPRVGESMARMSLRPSARTSPNGSLTICPVGA